MGGGDETVQTDPLGVTPLATAPSGSRPAVLARACGILIGRGPSCVELERKEKSGVGFGSAILQRRKTAEKVVRILVFRRFPEEMAG